MGLMVLVFRFPESVFCIKYALWPHYELVKYVTFNFHAFLALALISSSNRISSSTVVVIPANLADVIISVHSLI